MAVDLEQLNLTLTGDASDATKAIQSTVGSLKALGRTLTALGNSAAEVSKISSIFKELHNGVNAFNQSDSDKLKSLGSGLTSITRAMSSLKNINAGAFRGLPGAILAVTQAVDSIDPAAIKRVEDMADALRVLRSTKASDLSNVGSSVSNAMNFSNLSGVSFIKDTLSTTVKLFGTLGRAGISAVKGISNALKKLRSALDLSNTALGKLINKFASRALSMAIRSLIKAITSAFKDGLEMLYHTQSQAKKTLDALATSMSGLKASAGSALYSAISMVSGALQTLISYATAAMNAISQLFAALSGATTYFRGATQATQAYDSSARRAGSSSNKLANSLLKIDEINKLNDDKSGGGGGSSGSTPGWMQAGQAEIAPISQMILDAVESGDFSEIGAAIARKINDALGGINWDFIKARAVKFANSLATLINGFFGEIDPNTIGDTLAGIINSGVAAVEHFWYTVDWEQIGRKLRSSIGKAFRSIDAERLGRALVGKFRSAIVFLRGLLEGGIDWDSVKNKLVDLLDGMASGITAEDLVTFADNLCSAIEGAVTTLDRLVNTPTFQKIVDGIVRTILRMFENFPGIAHALFKLALDLWNSFVSGLRAYFQDKSLGQIVLELWHGVKSAFQDIEIPTSLKVAFAGVAFAVGAFNAAKIGIMALLRGNFGSLLSGIKVSAAAGNGLLITGGIGFLLDGIIKGIGVASDIATGDTGNLAKSILDAVGSALTGAGLLAAVSVNPVTGAIVVGVGLLVKLTSILFDTSAEGLHDSGLGEVYDRAMTAAQNLNDLYEIARNFAPPDLTANMDLSQFEKFLDDIMVATSGEHIEDINDAASALNMLVSAFNGSANLGEASDQILALAAATGSFDMNQLTDLAQKLGVDIANMDTSSWETVASAAETAATSVESLADSHQILTEEGSTAETQMSEVVTVIHEIPTKTQITIELTNYYQLINQLQTVINRLNGIRSKTITVTTYEYTWRHVGAFASGGFVNSGDLFVANERGAEMVGSIGGKSAVANQAEIGDAIFKYMDKHDRQSGGGMNTAGLANAIVSALKSAGLGAVYLDGKQLAQSIRNESHRVGRSVV